MKIKVISLSLFFLLAISSLTIASADSMALNSNHAQQNAIEKLEKIVQTDASNIYNPQHLQIDIVEDLAIRTNDMLQQEKQNDLDKKILGIHKTINLSEKLEVAVDDFDQNAIAALKQNSDRQTTMERIWNADRIRFNGKSIVINNVQWDEQTLIDKSNSLIENGKDFLDQFYITDQIENNIVIVLDRILFIRSSIEEISTTENHVTLFFETSNSIKNDFIVLTYDLVDTKNPIILLLLVPLAGYILIRSEEKKLEFYNFKQILSFCFVSILISSVVITPVSISSSYWGIAYAEEINTNATESVEPTSSSRSKDAPTNHTTQGSDLNDNTTSNTEAIMNSTIPSSENIEFNLNQDQDLIPDNSTLPSIPDNSTLPSIPDNSTLPSIPDNSTSTELFEILSVSDIVTNSTLLETPTNSTLPSIPDNSTSTELFEILSVSDIVTNSTLLETPTNSTLPSIPDNSTSTELFEILSVSDIVTNSTLLETPTNSTLPSIPDNSTSTELFEILSVSDIVTNSTLPSMPDNTQNEVIQNLPNATLSWQFDSLDTVDTNIIGDTVIEEALNQTALALDGVGDFVQVTNTSSVIELKSLSVSAWMKPDYSEGSPEFTVISKEKAFVLAINNNIPPSKIAKFSVFDGIKWSTVESTTSVEEEWTHLAATFNGSSISIYVNGNLESTLPLPGVLFLSVNGQLKATTVDSISSDSDIVIGAYLATKKGELKVSNQFSGFVDDIRLYDSLLDQSQINEIYLQRIASAFNNELFETLSMSDTITNSTLAVLDNSTLPSIPDNSTSTELLEILAISDAANTASTAITTNTTSFSESIGITDIVNTYANTEITNSASSNLTESLLMYDTLNQDVLGESKILLELKTIKENYLITETPEFEFQYYTDLDILNKAQAKINQAKDQLDILQENINQTENPILEAVINTQEQIERAQQIINKVKEDKKDEQQISDAVDTIKETMDQIKETNHIIQEADIQKSNLANISDTTSSVQLDKWEGNDETITVQTFDPDGNLIDVETTFEQVLDGKFSIELASTRNAKPGVYTIKTTLIKDGESYTTEDQFAWGLVSVNTKKSIYRPAETADFIIVVLDNGGHPVCNADIVMNISDPNLQNTILSSGNGITPNQECGLYDAQFTTVSEGNHTVNISAETPNGVTSFSTYFLVAENFDFDIIRTTASKIDPISNPNSFNVRIDVTSFVDTQSLTIQEFVPSVFGVVTDAKVQTIGNTKVLTWNKDLIGNKIFLEYSYSVPLEFPRLYALGPLEITYGQDKTFKEARPWFVAVDPAGQHARPETDDFVGVWTTDSGGITNLFQTIDEVTASDTDFVRSDTSAVYTEHYNATLSSVTDPQTSSGHILSWRYAKDSSAGRTIDIHLSLYSGITHIVTRNVTSIGNFFTTETYPLSTAEADAITNYGTLKVVIKAVQSGNGQPRNAQVSWVDFQVPVAPVSLSATLNISDQLTKSVNKSLSQTFSIVDDLTIGQGKQVSLSETLALGATFQTGLAISPSEALNISATLTTSATIIVSLTESLSLTATVDTAAAKAASLIESLTLTADLQTTAAKSASLTESLALVANVDATATTIVSLTESLSLVATAATSAAKAASLSESLSLVATAATSAAKVASLSESLSLVATAATSAAKVASLSESLSLVATAATAAAKVASLSESLSLVATAATSAAKAASLTESLSLVASAATSAAKAASLSESLSLVATVDTAAAKVASLSESLSLVATAATSAAKVASLSESLSLVASAATSAAKVASLSESLSLVADLQTAAAKVASLSESLSLVATAATSAAKAASLSESLSLVATATTTVAKSTLLSEQMKMAGGLSFMKNNVATLTVDVGGTVTIPVSTTISMQLTSPDTSGTGTATLVSIESPTSGTSTISFLGSIMDIALSGVSCATGCPITFTFTDADLSAAGISSPSEVVIFRDSEEDGTFVALTTTLTDGAPSPYTVSATTFSTSLFGAGKATAAPSSGPSLGPSSAGGSGGGGGRTGIGSSGGFGGVLALGEPTITPIDPAAPKIFDVKFQLGNGTKIRSSETTIEYVNYQSMSVSAIADSITPLKRAELRFIKLGQSLDQYTAIVMDIKPLQISNTTYTVSGTIPQRLMEGPALVYWIHVLNEAVKVVDSDKYTIGVKPNYSADGNLEFDIIRDRAEGTTARPIAYFTNEAGKPVYGTISIVADGKIVYVSPAQLFDVGQTAVKLEWKIPRVGELVSHQIQTKAEFYGKSFESETTMLNAFPATKTMSLFESSKIELITDNDGKAVASPAILYSSFKDEDNMRYRVIAPDGTCVIGGSEECLVKESTFGQRGNFESVTIGDQILRVRYSGPDNPLERFSITSVDPILGQWYVEIDSEDGLVPQAHAMKDTFLKIKYRATETPFVSEMLQ